MLRGTLGATGVAGAALVGSGLLEPAYAGFPQIRFFLDKAHYEPGEAMTLKLKEDVRRPLKVRVTDSRGTVWTKSFKNDRRQVWKATAAQTGGTGIVTILMRRSDGRVFRRAVAYSVAGGHPAPGACRDHPDRDELAGKPLGRAGGEVGAGLAARRIFADLGQRRHQPDQAGGAGTRRRHAAGHLLQGRRRRRRCRRREVQRGGRAGRRQAGLLRPADRGDVLARALRGHDRGGVRRRQQAAAADLQAGELRVGPILNGWLLDNKRRPLRVVLSRRALRRSGTGSASTPTSPAP